MTIKQLNNAGYEIVWNAERTIPSDIKHENGKWVAVGPEVAAPAFEVRTEGRVVGVGKSKVEAVRDFEQRVLAIPCTVR